MRIRGLQHSELELPFRLHANAVVQAIATGGAQLPEKYAPER